MPYPLADALQARATGFSVRVLKFVRSFGSDPDLKDILRQLTRAGTGVSMNYRAARRARSRAEFIARLGVVVEEADEAEKWLAMLKEADLASGPEFEWLAGESRELRAIFAASLQTARANHRAAQQDAGAKRRTRKSLDP